MQAIANSADLNAFYHQSDFPASLAYRNEPAIADDALLPEKSANETEVDRHAYYFDFADQAKAKLQSRSLWDEDNRTALPDAGERLKAAFSTFLTSFVSFGTNNDSAKPAASFPAPVVAVQVVLAPFTGLVFVFNKIVSRLNEAFPAQKAYLDQSGKLSYFSASAAHSLVSAILPVISEVRASQIDPISSIVLVSLELLLGFYATVTATEASLARQGKKSELLTELINAKDEAKAFFGKARAGLTASASEAAAYEKFMTAISKLDKFSSESKFGTRIAATSATKEWLWFGGAVVGNETAYKNLASTQVAVSGPELLGTALSEMALSLIANFADLVQGVIVYCRCDQKIKQGIALGKQLYDYSRNKLLPVLAPVIQGLAAIIGKKIDDERFEQGFSQFRIFKALVFVSLGIAAIVALAVWGGISAAWLAGLAAGVIASAFFIYLIVRTVRASDSARDAKKAEEEFKEQRARLNGTDEVAEKISENKFFLFHALSVSLVDMPERWQKGGEFDLLFAALDFQEIEIALLKTLASSDEADREKKVEMVMKQLSRMMELKLAA